MVLGLIDYPQIDPVLFSLGPFSIRWYALAYLAGLILGWWYVRRLASRDPKVFTRQDADDFLMWATIGVVLGGRLGYVLFYKPGFYIDNPLAIIEIWKGGMSFHGGMIGVALALYLFCRRKNIRFLGFTDAIALAAPIGLFFGRIANFINAELWGRPTDVSWAMIFPTDPLQVPRHPSQLYEAFLEGLILFAVVNWLAASHTVRERFGTLTGVFLIGYGLSRFLVEYTRQPDAHLGYIAGFITMGQILSLPMIALGIYLIWRASRSQSARAGSASG